MCDDRDATNILLAKMPDKIRNKMVDKKYASHIMDSLQLMLDL